MKYKIVWSAFSEKQIDGIFNYYTQKATYKLALDIVTKILLAPDILIDNPKIGQKEHTLQQRLITYHYILALNYKIIYSIDDDEMLIKIADVFDTRQNPNKIEREK
ncbi:type II toxin-antitoxin system RelE/ParE family toxin [Paenimyroides baculatum]|uniref:Type II toxin-antitoxin system RelE/ParE family toxin n=1 Tax=Paenimyroides baculatum TaxID=2608000 RepID=A0A5M6CWC0_9FLAO|nr:type II toxin-antitoxin system RelE/ParE family toxin [Paenimyroides baculatum]KAA5538292.1 type II toxin-antitoxin system RelE/ParE family toxin [Paenimyroides baculatum]